MAWMVVAEGTSISNLQQVVNEMELPKGTKVKVTMETWAPWAFDIAGAELIFQPFVPDGLDLIDVYGEGNQGIVDLEADPAWLVATLAFIKAHWLAITLSGLALATLITYIIVMINVPAIAQIPVTLLVGAAVGIVGITLLAARRST